MHCIYIIEVLFILNFESLIGVIKKNFLQNPGSKIHHLLTRTSPDLNILMNVSIQFQFHSINDLIMNGKIGGI